MSTENNVTNPPSLTENLTFGAASFPNEVQRWAEIIDQNAMEGEATVRVYVGAAQRNVAMAEIQSMETKRFAMDYVSKHGGITRPNIDVNQPYRPVENVGEKFKDTEGNPLVLFARDFKMRQPR